MVCGKKKNFLLQFLTFNTTCFYCYCVTFNDVTDTVFRNSGNCVIAAFGDFNSDKLTDIFCLQNDGKTLEIFITEDRKQVLPNNKLLCSVSEGEIITSVMPGDFNGDSMMDVLITVNKDGNQLNQVRLLWGNLKSLNCSTLSTFSSSIQPLILDYDGDMIPDLFVESENGTRLFWTVEKSTLIPKPFASLSVKVNQRIRGPHSCAFVDLNYDLEADLFVSGTNTMEYWLHTENSEMESHFKFDREINYPKNYAVFGQSVFVDINGDGYLEHIMPVCKDGKSMECVVMIRALNESEWKLFFNSQLSFKNESWCFKQSSQLFEHIDLPMTFRNADFDMDGMPDFLTIVANEGNTQQQALLLKNVPCSNCPFGRTLFPLWNLLGSVQNVVLTSFYELFEDGIIDVLINTKTDSKYKLIAFQNLISADAYFIKVLVIGGQCYDSCPGGHVAYGINQPGPCITYQITGPDGSLHRGSMTQLSQSAHFALQLPYSIFGLGQTPNFVDEVKVVVPGSPTNEKHQRTWPQIIPNSQIVVIPFPPNNPKQWVAKLFVTPSHSILLTFFALVGTCLFICLIIVALHWKERRADRRERLLEAHRFHFDAM